MERPKAKEHKAKERFVQRALVLSVLIHLLLFGLWREGRAHGWWNGRWRPNWMQALAKRMTTPIPVKAPPKTPPPQPMPLIFVDTDPALAVAEPPKDAKFYSANNTLAANKEIKTPSDMPNIVGSQTHELKATDNGKPKAQTMQPTPKQEPSPEEHAASQPRSQQSQTPGDLAMVKPRELIQTNTGKADVGNGTANEAQPEHHRPRTLAEARAQHGNLGQRIRQSGGVPNVHLDTSFAAIGTSYGDYDAEFVDAVRTRWYQLLEQHNSTAPGHVTVRFTLLSTGRVVDMKVTENTVDDLSAVVCTAAVRDNAPYRPWPRQMQIDLGTDHREVQFTFFYDSE